MYYEDAIDDVFLYATADSSFTPKEVVEWG